MKTMKFRDEDYSAMLAERLRALEELAALKEKALKGAPEGELHTCMRRGHVFFYRRKSANEKTGHYIRKTEEALIAKLAQKKYDRKALALIKQEAQQIRSFLKRHKPSALRRLYSGLYEEEKRYVTPVCMEDADFVRAWRVADYEQPAFREGTAEFYTKRGERVRSKSEIIIADALHEMGVPYMYECPLKLGGGIVVHPDFTVLNLRTRKTLYWEHLGMLDDRDYLQNALRKVAEYEKSGIYPGTELIITAETGYMPLGNAELKNVIRHYCF